MSPSRYRLLLLLAIFLEAGYLGMHSLGNLGERSVEFIALYLLVSLLYLVGCYLITRERTEAAFSDGPRAERFASRRLLVLIWGAGVVFRLTLLPLDPTLSEDLNRYRWQGKLQAAGGNPYVEIPDDPRWEPLRDRTWAHVNRKDLPSVYGPLLEMVYAGYYRVVSAVEPDEIRQVWLFKLPFAALELAVGAAVLQLLAAAGAPQTWLLIYLWSPLIVVEFWAQGHNDSLAVLFVVLALAAASRERWTRAFASLSLAALAKFWPAVLFPFFLLQRREKGWILRWKPALVALPLAFAVSWPYWGGISNVTELLKGFVGGWRNNDSLYGLLYQFSGEDFERGTTLVTRLLIAALAALWSLQLPLAKAAKWAVVLILLFSANCFPWYLSWLVPLLALYPGAPLLLWTALVVLSYQVLIGYQTLGVWEDSSQIRLLEYAPVYSMLCGVFVARYARRFWEGRRGFANRHSEPPA
jgi:alpha-1,6-mannosyltransferase